jgi:hypothetical protein
MGTLRHDLMDSMAPEACFHSTIFQLDCADFRPIEAIAMLSCRLLDKQPLWRGNCELRLLAVFCRFAPLFAHLARTMVIDHCAV